MRRRDQPKRDVKEVSKFPCANGTGILTTWKIPEIHPNGPASNKELEGIMSRGPSVSGARLRIGNVWNSSTPSKAP